MNRRGKREVGPLVVTAVIHVAIIALLTSVLQVPVLSWLRPTASGPQSERVVEFEIARPPAPEPPRQVAPPSTDSAARAATPPIAGEPSVAGGQPPAVVFGGAAGAADSARRDSAVGRGDPTDPLAGLRAGDTDPRLRAVAGGIPGPQGAVRAPRVALDSAASAWVAAYWDSVARVHVDQRSGPPDWTIRRGDNTYGIDQQFIYFGKYKLPTALLALLPIPVQANPTAIERNRALNAMRQDILYHAMRAQNEDDFNESVRRIRERIERERAAGGRGGG